MPTPQADSLLSPCVLVVKTPVASRERVAEPAGAAPGGGSRDRWRTRHGSRSALSRPCKRPSLAWASRRPWSRSMPSTPGPGARSPRSSGDLGRRRRHPPHRLALGHRGRPARRQLRAAVERGLSDAHPAGDPGAGPGADRAGDPAAAAGRPHRGRDRGTAAASGAQRRPHRA